MSAPVVFICPHCGQRYTLGKNGTVEGCDECEGIIRNHLDNSIIFDPETGVIYPDDEEDTLTDMEKA
jgi:hypothetical protein